MPGGRLTLQERRRIVTGLAEGLSYTDIARRLERPTSTVTREVMRNGGPHDYRADRAQQATERRARRRGGRRVAAAPAPPRVRGRDPRAVGAFEERLTGLLVATGLPRMTAAVLACLYTTDTGSLTAAELVQRLRVSPASVSKAVGFLEEQELIRRERDPRRRDRYVIDDDVWFRAMLASARLNAAIADEVRWGAGVMGAGTPAAVRLESMGRFLSQVGEDLAQAAEHWRQVIGADESPSPHPADTSARSRA
ncbi:helix-turn-helix domain-containing protein [Streptomyces orinoci]|uniref:Helix-turn-helix domain-containing protein n=1 Tax=Streptomyces orinoci TaxID=67339 RepID=A0ABV3JVM5_STRON|nr:helix-turn-helix domain-containing protein [Streptomyces orinoci]